MLGERENEILLRKWSGVTAQLRTLAGTLFSSIRFDSLFVAPLTCGQYIAS